MEFRDLQIEYGVAKEDFPEWYKRYRVFLHEQAELKHIEMILKYGEGTPPMTHEEAYDILSCTGIFHDFCTDEYEQEEVTEQFVAMCNGY